uniref:Homeobox protein NANOG n=1 Tax=Peromyscus maniculatus bairdii TaxID=230844 RepID=A0A8C8UN81_PERMB
MLSSSTSAIICLFLTASPCPSSVDLPRQDSPDSSTRPKLKLTGPESEEDAEKEDNKVHTKKQKMRTVFSQAQLCALRERFQRQRYLNLQQMQELSAILNLSYKQVKTWFQNQRMKCKRWQKSQWQKSNGVTQVTGHFTDFPLLPPSYFAYSIPKTYMASHNCLQLQFQHIWFLQSTDMYTNIHAR